MKDPDYCIWKVVAKMGRLIGKSFPWKKGIDRGVSYIGEEVLSFMRVLEP